MKPDLIWRCRGDRAEISQGADLTPPCSAPMTRAPWIPCAADRPLAHQPAGRACPPMAAGVFGAIAYDMVRLVEPLPDVNPDPLGLTGFGDDPSVDRGGCSTRSARRSCLTTPGRPSALAAGEAYAAARARLAETIADLRRPLPAVPDRTPLPQAPLESTVTRQALWRDRERAKAYSAPATSSRWCPATGSARRSRSIVSHFTGRCVDLTRHFHVLTLTSATSQLAGSSPEIMVRLRDGRSPFAHRRHPATGQDSRGGPGPGAGAAGRSKERAGAPDAAGSGPQRRGPRGDAARARRQ